MLGWPSFQRRRKWICWRIFKSLLTDCLDMQELARAITERTRHGCEKVPNWECSLVNREKGLFLSVHVDDIKLAGKKQNISPTWKMLMKDVDVGEPTSFLDLVYLGCTQRQCEINTDIVDNYRTMLESRISAGDLLFAHKLFWNVCIWLVLGDPIFYCLWINLLERLQNGQKLVTNVWRVWSPTIITHVNSGNIVMWVTQHNNNAD